MKKIKVLIPVILIVFLAGIILYTENVIKSNYFDKGDKEMPDYVDLNLKHEIDGNVGVWLTTTNLRNLLTEQQPIDPDLKQSIDENASIRIIGVNSDKTYQVMDGFGASFTDASAWLVRNALNEQSRLELMTKLFCYEDGIGMSFLRQPMGASDFAHKLYTYNDMPVGETDYELEHFSIDHDKEYIIPSILEAKSINPMLKVMASPWSPPAWMKTSDNLIGGSLRREAYDVYSRYFSAFIKAYEAEGIPIYAITPQNEPLHVPTEYTGMKMLPHEQIEFINGYLGPELERNNIDAKILAYDHNWDNVEYAIAVLQNAGRYVDGSAWHCYGGTHDAMTIVHNKFPDKGIWFTEASGGEWVPPFHAAFADQMMHVIRSTRNYSRSVVWWNIALDQYNGPTVLENSTCRGIVTINTYTGEIEYNLDYYTMGHISKFVKPGALRIDSDNYMNDVESVAFENPDKSIVLIVSNRTANDRVLNIKYGKSDFKFDLPGRAAVTFRWLSE